jgi:hypothetical protein
MKKNFLILLLIVIPSIAFGLPEDVYCFNVTDGTNCAVACTDNTIYFMPCDADIFQ